MSANLTSTELKRLHRSWRRTRTHSLALGLDGVQGPHNVGSAIRSAASFGAKELLLCNDATGPENTKVGRTALGSDRYVEVQRFDEPVDLVAHATNAGFRVIGVELASGAAVLSECDLAGDVCLIVGHEERGLSKAMLEALDEIAYIPQVGKIGSLNVATAASIAMYEWSRQQTLQTSGSRPGST